MLDTTHIVIGVCITAAVAFLLYQLAIFLRGPKPMARASEIDPSADGEEDAAKMPPF